jgi:hypothetical protein
MGKHATQGMKIAFLAHLQDVTRAEAARLAGPSNSAGKDLKARAGALCIEYAEAGLLLPILEEQVQRKPGSGAKIRLTEELVTQLLKACTLNENSRKKLWYNNYSEAMFWGRFSYDHKGPCHIYYKETEEQKDDFAEKIDELNDREIEAECRVDFEERERLKEESWLAKGKKFPKNRATWEVYWKNNKQRGTASQEEMLIIPVIRTKH